MIGIRTATLLVGLSAALVGSAAYAEDSPFIGKWRWNRAQSTLPPGEPAPKDVMSDISKAEGSAVSWTVTIVTPDDQKHVVKFEADPTGDAQHGANTTASARASAAALEATFKGPDGQSDTQTCTVSEDRKQMSCKGVLNDGEGHSASYVDVYDRM